MERKNQHLETRCNGLIIDTTGSMRDFTENQKKIRDTDIMLTAKRNDEVMAKMAENDARTTMVILRLEAQMEEA